MIDIRVLSGQSFDTGPDTYMVFELVSDIFNTGDSFEVSKTYPVDLPLTRKNKRLIGNKHLIENRGREKKRIDVIVYLNDKPFKKGVLKYEISATTIKGALKVDSGEAAAQIKDISLNEALYSIQAKKQFFFSRAQMRAHMLATATDPLGTHDYVFFPYRNGSFGGRFTVVFRDVQPDDNIPQIGDVYSCNNAEYRIITIIRIVGSVFILEGEMVEGYELPPPSGTLTRVQGDGPASYTYASRDLRVDKVDQVDYNFIVNAWGVLPDSTRGFLDKGSTDGDFYITPFLRLVPLIRMVCRFLGFEATGNVLEEEEINRLVVFNTWYLDRMNSASAGEQVNIDYHFMVPPIGIGEFFKRLKREYGISFFFDSIRKTVSVNIYKELAVQQRYIDLSPYAIPGYSISEESLKGYSVKVATDPADRLYPDQEEGEEDEPDFVYGDGEGEWDTGTGTLFMLEDDNPHDPGASWLVPHAEMRKATVTGQGADIKFEPQFSFRLLYYRGMQEDSQGNLYPFGSSDVLNYAGDVIGETSLKVDSPLSFIRRNLVPYFQFLSNTEKVPMRFLLPYHVLDQLDFADKLGVTIRNEVLLKYLPGKIRFELPARGGKVLTEIDMYPLLQKDIRGFGSNDFSVDGPLYYVKMKQENFRTVHEQSPERVTQLADFRLYFYSDELATVPVDPGNLTLQIAEKVEDEINGFTWSITHTVSASGTSFLALPDATLRYQEYDGTTFDLVRDDLHTYSLLPGISYRSV